MEMIEKIWIDYLGFSTMEHPTSLALGFGGIGFVLCLLLALIVGQDASMYCSFVVVGGLVLNFIAGFIFQTMKNKKEEEEEDVVVSLSDEKVEKEIPKANEYKTVANTDVSETIKKPVAKKTKSKKASTRKPGEKPKPKNKKPGKKKTPNNSTNSTNSTNSKKTPSKTVQKKKINKK